MRQMPEIEFNAKRTIQNSNIQREWMMGMSEIKTYIKSMHIEMCHTHTHTQ